MTEREAFDRFWKESAWVWFGEKQKDHVYTVWCTARRVIIADPGPTCDGVFCTDPDCPKWIEQAVISTDVNWPDLLPCEPPAGHAEIRRCDGIVNPREVAAGSLAVRCMYSEGHSGPCGMHWFIPNESRPGRNAAPSQEVGGEGTPVSSSLTVSQHIKRVELSDIMDDDEREAAEAMAAARAYTGAPFPSIRALSMMSRAIRALDAFRAKHGSPTVSLGGKGDPRDTAGSIPDFERIV